MIRSPYLTILTSFQHQTIKWNYQEHFLAKLIENNFVIDKKTQNGLSFFHVANDSQGNENELNKLPDKNHADSNLNLLNIVNWRDTILTPFPLNSWLVNLMKLQTNKNQELD